MYMSACLQQIDFSPPVRVLGIPGSLRRGSHNRSLLMAAARVAPPGMEVEVYDGVQDIPVFNQDLEEPGIMPRSVESLREAVAAADGLLIATPEYNQSVPGAVKNLIDWLSRGDGLAGRPIAVIGASTGQWGTRIAQTLLRQMLLSVGAVVMPAPSLFVPHVEALLGPDGEIEDEETLMRLGAVLGAFGEWVRLLVPDLAFRRIGSRGRVSP